MAPFKKLYADDLQDETTAYELQDESDKESADLQDEVQTESGKENIDRQNFKIYLPSSFCVPVNAELYFSMTSKHLEKVIPIFLCAKVFKLNYYFVFLGKIHT